METTEADIQRALELARAVVDGKPAKHQEGAAEGVTGMLMRLQCLVKAEVDRSAEIARALIACREPVTIFRVRPTMTAQISGGICLCGKFINAVDNPRFCYDCGRPIKWE